MHPPFLHNTDSPLHLHIRQPSENLNERSNRIKLINEHSMEECGMLAYLKDSQVTEFLARDFVG